MSTTTNNDLWNSVEQKQDFSLYTGVTNLSVNMLNPNREQLAKHLGIDADKLKEPDYTGKIVFRLSNDKIKVPVTFWPSNEEVVSKDGTKKMYINYYGKTRWMKDASEAKDAQYFEDKGVHVARQGETELYNFIIEWVNIDLDKGKFEFPYDNILAGDYSLLESAIEKFSDRQVKCLVGVRGGKYMEAYNRDFGHENLRNLKRFEKAMEAPGFKLDSSLEFKTYTAPKAPDVLESMMEDSDDDDLPF